MVAPASSLSHDPSGYELGAARDGSAACAPRGEACAPCRKGASRQSWSAAGCSGVAAASPRATMAYGASAERPGSPACWSVLPRLIDALPIGDVVGHGASATSDLLARLTQRRRVALGIRQTLGDDERANIFQRRELRVSRLQAGGSDPLPLSGFRLRDHRFRGRPRRPIRRPSLGYGGTSAVTTLASPATVGDRSYRVPVSCPATLRTHIAAGSWFFG